MDDDTKPVSREPIWEPITRDTERLRVPGGWVYRTGLVGADGIVRFPMSVYVPDPATQREILSYALKGVR